MSKIQKKSNTKAEKIIKVNADKTNKIDALIFIDNNIFLDFYRMPSEKISLQFLDEIVAHKDIIICSTQSEMEFKNSRFSVLKVLLDDYNKIGSFGLMVPDMFIGDESDALVEARKEIAKHQKALSKKLTQTLENPEKDEVFTKLEALFTNDSNYNLKWTDSLQDEIYNLAKRRFNLGYPPRKSGDKTFGDGFNWEWILKCAELSNKKVIIVSRDGDFGKGLNGPVLNTFLDAEVKKRVGENCEVILTDELSKAFEMVSLPLTDEMVEEEQKVISMQGTFEALHKNVTKWTDYMNMITAPIVLPGMPEYVSHSQKINDAFKGINAMNDFNKGLEHWRKFNGLNFGSNEDKNDD